MKNREIYHKKKRQEKREPETCITLRALMMNKKQRTILGRSFSLNTITYFEYIIWKIDK